MLKLVKRIPSAQSMVEFALLLPLIITVMFGIVILGYAQFERSAFDYSLSGTGFSLPSDWESYTDQKALVKEILSQADGLDPDRLEVVSANIEKKAATNSFINEQTEILDTTRSEYIVVTATVKYTFNNFGLFPALNTYERTFTRTFTTERQFEITDLNDARLSGIVK